MKLSREQLNKVWEEGYVGFLAGLEPEDNPYEGESEENYLWWRGWVNSSRDNGDPLEW